MKTRHREVSNSGPELPAAVKEIAKALLADDWYRMSTEDESRKYYVVRATDQAVEINGEADFNRMEFPIPTKSGPLSEWMVRSQLADNKPANFLTGARESLEKAGVAPSAIDAFLADMDDLSQWKFRADVSRDERLRLFANFLEAMRMTASSAHSLQLDADEASEAKIAREKICLREVAGKYGEIVDKWEQLDPLPFDDPQVEEASKAYLYGFYRSSVALGASALEKHLRRAAGDSNDKGLNYSRLVTVAAKRRGMDAAWAEQAKGLFNFRNRVVHDGHSPTHDEAGEVLSNVRSVVAQLLSAQR